ncbi:RNA recognition motif domain containing protein [Pseudohyphozyma bogoriensis]|nr:RNA recognition motif domain containing protein [Pseudohyphozyma bogoriensis]
MATPQQPASKSDLWTRTRPNTNKRPISRSNSSNSVTYRHAPRSHFNHFLENRMNSSSSTAPPASAPAPAPELIASTAPHLHLTQLDSVPKITSINHAPSPCTSCGSHPSSLASTDFVQLSCGHVVDKKCLNRLINAASNDPPRPMECFACLEEISGFVGVSFVEENGEGKESGAKESSPPSSPTWRSMDVEEGWKTPKMPKRTLHFNSSPSSSPSRLAELSPYKHFDWSESSVSMSTPSTSSDSGSMRVPHFSPSKHISSHEILKKTSWPVVRVDNIPWDLSVFDVLDWMPSAVPLPPTSTHALSIHILCSRLDGKTLNQMYLELPTLVDAYTLIRLKDGKKIVGRPISVVLASQFELMQQVFPAWEPGFDADGDAAKPEEEGVLVTNGDLESLLGLCSLETAHATKAPERPFLQLATILQLPFHQPEMWDIKLSARLFKTVQTAFELLEHKAAMFAHKEDAEKVRKILDTDTPPSSSPNTPSSTFGSSNSRLRSPTLDRVKHTDHSPMSTASRSPPVSPLRFGSPTRRTFAPSPTKPKAAGGLQVHDETMLTNEMDLDKTKEAVVKRVENVDLQGLAKSLGVEVEVARKVIEGGLRLL